ncbi:MAG: sensor histidine kinase [Nitrospirota bacterium]
MKLWIKIGTLVTLIVAGCVVSLLVLTERRTAAALRDEQAHDLELMAGHIAEEIEEPLLRQRFEDITLRLKEHRARNEDITYLFVKDGTGKIIAHTFPGEAPKEFLDAVYLGRERDHAGAVLPGGDVYHLGIRITRGGEAELHAGVSERRHRTVIRTLHHAVIGTGAFFILLGAGLSFGAVYMLSRPLQTIVDGLQVMGQGDLDHRISVSSRDEVGSLAREFNEMADRRRATEDEIMKLNFELEENVEQRTAQLTAANKELEAFAYSVSHDLRAPLRSIDGFSKALLDDYLDKLDAEGRDHLKRIRKASQRMGKLIDDLLKLSRLTRGDMFIEQVDLSAMARDVIGNLQAADPGRAVKAVVQENISGAADRTMVRVVLENLLGNAWKYTSRQAQPRIMFGMAGAGGAIAYFIKDNGAGFDMLYSQKLFGVFQRLHSEMDFPGTGIGLATVQRIIHRHGGRVWAEGEVGKGATFYFTLGREA